MNVRDPHPVEMPDYRLIRRIGSSSAASVYAATELSSGRPRAVKIFHRVDVDSLARLERQLQANAQLAHPNIVRVNGTGHTRDGRLFYSMPLLTGLEGLRPNLLGRPLRIARPLRDLLAGLEYAHQRGVVHGDIKPSNVLFDEQGRAQLADLGIARCMAEAQSEASGVHADLHAVGMLAYELIAGATAVQRVPLAPLPPGTAAWQVWIDRALAVSPPQQFQNAREMADALDPITGPARRGPDHAVAPVQPDRAPKRIPYTAIVITAIVVSAGWALWGNQRAPEVVSDNVPAASVANPAVPSAVSVENPAAPAAAAQPAPALSAMTDSASPLADRAQALVTTADTLRTQGHLFSPPFHNAASKYLAALMLDPGDRSATAGIDATLTALQGQLDRTWHDGRNTSEAAGMLRQGDELAKHADAPSRRAWRNHRKRLAYRVGHAYARAAGAHDALVLAALAPLAKALGVASPGGLDPATAAGATDAPVASTPQQGGRLRDPQGPLLVYVPATDNLPAFAIEQVEVTHADYAAFARATRRSAATCLAAHNPFSRLRHLSWRAPGFAQAGDQPVVCVSWDDAAAYAAWLSKTTGETYRLPSGDQWLGAAQGMPKGDPCKLGNVDDVSRRNRLDDDRWSCSDGAAYTAPVGHYAPSGVGAYDLYGNVSEWVAGGSAGSRVFRGLSWRDGSSHGNPLSLQGAADSDIGYTSVGFRVVRVIDAAHPAPTTH